MKVLEEMVVLDTRENKQKLRGDYGYVNYIKKHNLKISVGLVLACLLVFFIGLTLSNEITVFLNLISVLLILPTAQFMAKYFGFIKYKILDESKFRALEEVSNDFLVLGELPVIRGKRTYFLKTAVITKVGLYGLLDGEEDVKANRKLVLDTKEALTSIIKPKGFNEPIKLFTDYDSLYNELKTKVKSQAFDPDEKELARLAQTIILKTQ